jgi:WASH complex subunit 7
MLAKDKLFKKAHLDAYFSDDGFVLGVAFILKILDQHEKFLSLNWFDAVDVKLMHDEEVIKKVKKGKQEENTEVEMSARKVNSQKQEFNLLSWSFTSAEILIKEI